MSLINKTKNHNPNYLAKIIVVKNLRKHPNADRLNVFTVDGNDIITSNQTPEGQISVYFPLECQIAHELLSANNDYRKAKDATNSTFGLNADPEAAGGFFDKNGRVRAVKLREQKSEGYVVPISYLEPLVGDKYKELEKHIGEEFDEVEGIKIVKKYVIKSAKQEGSGNNQRSAKQKISKLIDNQFRLHYDTAQLGKNTHKIKPDDIISVSWKMHGTSFVSSKVLCTRKLKWYERIARILGVRVQETEYDNIYSSRKVVKNDDLNKNANHYYGYDLWADINDIFKDNLLAGETIYGEAVGYLKDGGFIQKGFDYGCKPGEFKVYVYRITHTTTDGKVIDLPYNMVEERCEQLGVEACPLIYFGRAGDFVPDEYADGQHIPLEEWRELFLRSAKLAYVNDQDSQFCTLKVPEEGIVVRVEGLKPEAFKLKSFRFLEGESKALDKGEVSIEDEQSDEGN